LGGNSQGFFREAFKCSKTLSGELATGDMSTPAGRKFELVIVDALANRTACSLAGLSFLSKDGVLLWANNDGPDWREIEAMMSLRGF
jgi:hypothetical protein